MTARQRLPLQTYQPPPSIMSAWAYPQEETPTRAPSPPALRKRLDHAYREMLAVFLGDEELR